MCGAVHKPSEVQRENVTGHGGHEEGIPIALSEEVVGQVSRQVEAEEECERDVELFLETDHRVLEEIGTVHRLPSAGYFGVLLAHQPAHVSEEESAVHVVGIGVSFRVFVMHSVVSSPLVQVILEWKGKISDLRSSVASRLWNIRRLQNHQQPILEFELKPFTAAFDSLLRVRLRVARHALARSLAFFPFFCFSRRRGFSKEGRRKKSGKQPLLLLPSQLISGSLDPTVNGRSDGRSLPTHGGTHRSSSLARKSNDRPIRELYASSTSKRWKRTSSKFVP